MYSGQGTTYYSIFEAHSPVLDDQLPLNDEQLPTSLDPLFLFPDTEQYPVSVPIPIPLEPRGIDAQTQQMSTSASFLAEFSSDKCSFFDHSPSMEDIISSVSSISPPYTIDAQLSQFSLPSLFSVYMDVPHEYFPSFRMDSLANLYPTPFLEISTPDMSPSTPSKQSSAKATRKYIHVSCAV
ncbi:hypothetical protein BCR43DRAFT_494265 [Syncephalastrum racemosum]|uniref:Uncharacterized protein n=1 Tax=Syncephalastrum racemosum TaxID=13706 RepID=A0A1X2H7Q1_SYNRA|nr:hypothetical protein BCR43DRAFT_494265 [Syncephalastrum racemosum]